MKLGVLAVSVLLSSAAQSSEPICLQIAQPIQGTGAGIIIAVVPYVGYYFGHFEAVEFTVKANLILTDQGQQNLNLANLLGITLSPGLRAGVLQGESPGLHGDTLSVMVRVPPDSVMPYREYNGRRLLRYVPEHTVPATIQCLKENSRRRWPQVKYLEIMMAGNDAYAKYTGVYSLEAIAPMVYPHDKWDR